MGRVEDALSSAIAGEISQALAPGPGISDETDAAVQRATADALVREALKDGRFADITGLDLNSFSDGNTAMLVARVDTRLSFVVKVDRSPALIAEAHLLQRAAADPSLPESIRRTFPRVFAIDAEGPIYGYLMEDLGDFATIRESLVSAGPDHLGSLLQQLWRDVLEPTYRATMSKRVVANVSEDYFRRAKARLDHAAELGVLPGATTPIHIETKSGSWAAPEGWGGLLERGEEALHDVVPRFSTFVHGDLHPENVLWSGDSDRGFSFRVIDPKDWWVGDYLFDVAKFGHYLRVTAPVEMKAIDAVVKQDGAGLLISYDDAELHSLRWLEDVLIASVSGFATQVEGESWLARYNLAVSAVLLGIVGPRLAAAAQQGDNRDRSLALIALGEAARRLAES